MALSRTIGEIHMALLDITQYELVPAPEFPVTARYIFDCQVIILWCFEKDTKLSFFSHNCVETFGVIHQRIRVEQSFNHVAFSVSFYLSLQSFVSNFKVIILFYFCV